MPKVLMLTTAADPDGVLHAGKVHDVSKAEADELIAGGFARKVEASDTADIAPSERAVGRRGKTSKISGEEEA